MYKRQGQVSVPHTRRAPSKEEGKVLSFRTFPDPGFQASKNQIDTRKGKREDAKPREIEGKRMLKWRYEREENRRQKSQKMGREDEVCGLRVDLELWPILDLRYSATSPNHPQPNQSSTQSDSCSPMPWPTTATQEPTTHFWQPARPTQILYSPRYIVSWVGKLLLKICPKLR